MSAPRRVIIMGAAGRDFHNFNVHCRGNPAFHVVAFTATQIPDIAGRAYPSELCGPQYPHGIPILDEKELQDTIEREKVDEVVFSYSDVEYGYVGHRSALVHAAGASWSILGPKETQIKAKVPVISICAVRTGCGKSQTARAVCAALVKRGYRVAAIRHPMPYGDLSKQVWQRFACYDDLKKHECTIEEREEYEPHIDNGAIVFAGVDYAKILEQAEKEVDIILWDGGNNDWSFYKPDLQICVCDPHRPGHELRYFPGEVNVLTADVLVINKIDTANRGDVDELRKNLAFMNPSAIVVDAASPLFVDRPAMIKGKRVLCLEDGPTLTHGGMTYGAAYCAATKFGAAEIVDPRPFLKGALAETFVKYPKIGHILPAMGYGDKQIADLEATINASDVELVVSGTPIDITRVLSVNKPMVRVRYELQVIGEPTLDSVLEEEVCSSK